MNEELINHLFEGIVFLGNYAYSFSCRELDEKIELS